MPNIYDKILRDARMKLTEMFDRNFNRQGFFGKKWQPTKVSKTNKAGKKGSILIVTGAMRRSIRSEVRGNAALTDRRGVRFRVVGAKKDGYQY